MKPPKYAPKAPYEVSDKDPLEYRKIPGITFFDEDDGILYFYDKPIMFVAFIEKQQVVVTLLDEDCNYPENPRQGWYQHVAIAVTDELLHNIYNSKVPIRDLWDQKADNWFIQDEWVYLGKEPNNTGRWASEYKVFKNVELKDCWKPTVGTVLNPGASDEESKDI